MSEMSAHDVLKTMIRTNRGSMTVWSPAEVRDALAAYRAEILDEAEAALTARHCSPESVDTVHRLIDERLCTNCQGYGQTSEETPDGGIVRRCKLCNGQGLRRIAEEPRVVAYRSPGTRKLYCVICARQETGWQPVTEASEGTACDFCGGRVIAIASRTLAGVVVHYLSDEEK